MSKEDPWALDLDAGKATTKALKGGARAVGIPCPGKNNFGKKCFACEKAYALFQTGKPEDSVLAKKIYAKKAPVCNVEFLHERGKVYLMVLPVGVATSILDGMYGTMAWGNISHPNPSKEDSTSGYPLILSKGKEGEYIKYSVTPKIGAPLNERRVSGKSVLSDTYKLSTIMKDIAEEKDINYFFPRSDMSVGQRVEFKILPNMENPSQSPIMIGFVHFNISADEIYGRSSGQSTASSGFDNGDFDDNSNMLDEGNKGKTDNGDDLDLNLDEELF